MPALKCHVDCSLVENRLLAVVVGAHTRDESREPGVPALERFFVVPAVERDVVPAFCSINRVHERVELPFGATRGAAPCALGFATASIGLGGSVGVFANETRSDLFEEAAERGQTAAYDE